MKDTRRIFVAIPVPSDARIRIRAALERWGWLSVRWVPEASWHITVIPPFSATDSEIVRVETALSRIAQKEKPFSVVLDAFTLAPPGKKARMIWVSGPVLQRVQGLKEEIEREFLFDKVASSFRRFSKRPAPHITVARFQEGELSGLEEKTHVLQKTDVSFLASEFSLVESPALLPGVEYKQLVVFPFR